MAQKKVILDQQGQRKYPGKVTKIVGDTMATDGYGDISLWVIPDVGEPRMIHPNTGDHTFPGASSFTEYPQMQKGGQMKTPSNKGFEHLPKYVQKHILANMKQEGGQASEDPVYLNRGGMFQMGGEYIPEHLLTGLVMGENLPVMQVGGQPMSRKLSQAEWNKQNLASGYLPVPAAEGALAQSAYRKYYNPKLYSPSTTTPRMGEAVGFTNIANPSDNSGNPFIEYTIPNLARPQKSAVAIPEGHKPLDFSNPAGVYNPNTNVMTDVAGPNAKIIQPITEQYGQPILKQFGGEPASKFMANYYKKYGGSQAPQGETLDEVLQNKNRDFTNYIANNTKAAIFKEEANHFQNGFAQFGQQVNSDKALMSGETDYLSSLPNSFTAPIPRDAPRALPIGVRRAADQFGKMPAEKPFNGLDTRGTDPTFNYNNDGIDTGAIADIAMAGVQGLNSFFNNAQAVRQNNLNQDKLSIANNITPSYGSRGLYDINQGNFKPNQKTPYFQFGGTHGGELGSWDPKGENDRMTSIGKVDAAGFTRNPTSDNFAGTVPTFGKDGIGSKYYTRPEEKGPGLFSLGKAVGISSPMFKKGGQYEMDHKTILELISKGYQIEFLD